MVLASEAAYGYPHQELVIGHLNEAQEESFDRYPLVAERIRNIRHQYQLTGEFPEPDEIRELMMQMDAIDQGVVIIPDNLPVESIEIRGDAVKLSSLPKENGKVRYRGKLWEIDKPVPSDRPGKKMMVLAEKGGMVKLVHYGADGYSDFRRHKNPDRRQRFLDRMKGIKQKDGTPAYKDKFSPAYWGTHSEGKTW